MASKYAPVITAAGITAPDFATNLANLQADYRGIFGEDVYLGSDSQDGQFLAIVARAITDCGASVVASHNARSPTTAQGNGLSSVVKINGLARAAPSFSACDVTLVGVAGTPITNGQATDENRHTWALPALVTIPPAGTITVTATCTTPGAITAAIGTINRIKTPVFGWQSVANAQPAVAGAPVETDAALRARQSQSVAAPSSTIFEGVLASIANLAGVTRSRGYENAEPTPDANGIPAGSVAILVEGGDALTIAQTIARKMSPGTPTIGSISHTIINAAGSSRVARFSRPTVATIRPALTIKALSGWSASTQTIIAKAVSDFINTLRIGEDVRYFDVSVPAKIPGSPYASSFALIAMTLAKNAGAAAAADVVLAYNEAPRCDVADVTFTVT